MGWNITFLKDIHAAVSATGNEKNPCNPCNPWLFFRAAASFQDGSAAASAAIHSIRVLSL
jgi:hypothetical protein